MKTPFFISIMVLGSMAATIAQTTYPSAKHTLLSTNKSEVHKSGRKDVQRAKRPWTNAIFKIAQGITSIEIDKSVGYYDERKL